MYSTLPGVAAGTGEFIKRLLWNGAGRSQRLTPHNNAFTEAFFLLVQLYLAGY